MRLQYQLCNGNWVDCEDRTEEFLQKCVDTENIKIRKVFLRLAAGKILRNGFGDWYLNCRDADAIPKRVTKKCEMVQCDCGHMCNRISVMSTSSGISCPDCYDDMSM